MIGHTQTDPKVSREPAPTDSRRKGPNVRVVLRPDVVKENLPPLPTIHNEALLNQVFTHRSVFARPTHMFEDPPDDPSPDNEMLEHLGDSVLSLAVTELLRSIFPSLRVGPSTKIRALVVGNTTLAHISVMYGLHERLIPHPAQAVTLRASVHIQADLFEAYVGGVYRDSGLGTVQRWLHQLFLPWVYEAYRQTRVQHGLSPDPPSPPSSSTSLSSSGSSSPVHAGIPTPIPPSRSVPSVGHLSLFNQCLQQQNLTVEWVFAGSAGQGTKTTPIWVVQAMVRGECLGEGRGSTKKGAKNEAAKKGLKTLGANVYQLEMEV